MDPEVKPHEDIVNRCAEYRKDPSFFEIFEITKRVEEEQEEEEVKLSEEQSCNSRERD